MIRTAWSFARERFARARIGRSELIVGLLVINLFVLAGLVWKMEAVRPPLVATVSVSQLSRIYGEQFAMDPANTPQMIKLKTDIFMATTEKLIARASRRKGMVVFARECVLAGDSVDLTPEVTAAVDRALKAGTLTREGTGDAAITLAP